MLITEIMQYLADQGIGIYDPTGATGNIFMGVLPQSPDQVIAVTPTGGNPSSMKCQYDSPSVQVVVRGTADPRTGYSKALDVYGVMHGFGSKPFVSGGHWVVMCEGVQSDPASLGPDENNRFRYSLNFIIEIQRDIQSRG